MIFTDASTMAQAAAAYWVVEGPTGLDANLIAAKTKVTGLRQHEYIGRLELVAAVMGVALALKIGISYKITKENVTYFTDSMSVLFWLSTTSTLSAYAGHRVAKIVERSKFQQWNYVHTEENPSDLPTRGMRASELSTCELWWKGPKFLRTPPHEWPEQPRIRAPEAAAAEVRTLEEISKNIVMKAEEAPAKVDEQLKLVKIIMDTGHSVWRAIKMLAALSEGFHQQFNNAKFEMIFSKWEMLWIQHEQREFFKKLYGELLAQSRPSELVEMRPWLDSQGVIRVGTGLSHSLHHDWELVSPILLHQKMKYAVEYYSRGHRVGLAHQGGGSWPPIQYKGVLPVAKSNGNP